MKRKQNKFYLIEKYLDDCSGQRPFTNYSVRRFNSLDTLMKGLQKGPENSGTLIPTQALEFTYGVRQDTSARASQGNDTYYLIDEFEEEVQRYSSATQYDVRVFRNEGTLIKALQKGSKHNGKLIPTIILEDHLELR